MVFLDIECFSNYFLICFSDGKKVMFFEKYNNQKLDIEKILQILENNKTIGFNSNNYDMPMVYFALNGATNEQLKILSDKLVNYSSFEERWDILKEYNIYIPKNWDHVDLYEPAPGVRIGLKTYGARLNVDLLQDLPFDPDEVVTLEKKATIKKYCFNDVLITKSLYEAIIDDMKLRDSLTKKYNIDLRSKSNVQIAEALVKKELSLEKKKSQIKTESVQYTKPNYIQFVSEELNELCFNLQIINFEIDEMGKVRKNPEVPDSIDIGGNVYSFGIGGLHSTESKRAVIAADDEKIVDVDFTSYYPALLINNEYYPTYLGRKFFDFYKNVFETKKKASDKKDKVLESTCKLILNGIFGKLGNTYSVFYDPKMLISITLTGQLIVLMLIESITNIGCDVVSANTDGITIKCKKGDQHQKLLATLKEWEIKTKLELKYVYYSALYNESVNSYIAIKEDGEVKCKGTFADNGLTKNPVIPVCREAVIEYLKNGTNIKDFILNNTSDVKKIIVVRKASGGAWWKNNYLGKVVRWYYGKNGEHIVDGKKGNKVAESNNAIPLMDLRDEVKDICLESYVNKALEMLKNLGLNVRV